MRLTRWFNPSLPQTLQIAVFLLYFTGAFGLLGIGVLHLTNTNTPYLLVGLKLFNSEALTRLVEFAASAGFVLAGLLVANERKQGWTTGVALAAGAVVIPVVLIGSRLVSDYLITWLFDVALLALLLHPMSRNHQRVWFS